MQFIYDENAGQNQLNIIGDNFRYLSKVRRHKPNDIIFFRNLKDNFIYLYKCIDISKKEIVLKLDESIEKIVESSKKLHIIWAVVDPKVIEKQLPYLNELGVDKISFVYTKFSQKNFKLNFEKMNKILINSSQQCGRSSIIKLDLFNSSSLIKEQYPNTYLFNFSDNHIDDKKELIDTIMIGCEGGFTEDEIDNFESSKIVGINSDLILRSETAITAVASKLLL